MCGGWVGKGPHPKQTGTLLALPLRIQFLLLASTMIQSSPCLGSSTIRGRRSKAYVHSPFLPALLPALPSLPSPSPILLRRTRGVLQLPVTMSRAFPCEEVGNTTRRRATTRTGKAWGAVRGERGWWRRGRPMVWVARGETLLCTAGGQ